MWFGEPHLFHLPDWARRDNKVTKGDHVEYIRNMLLTEHSWLSDMMTV